jgi:hypothetical protein
MPQGDPPIRKGFEVWAGQYAAENGRYVFEDNDFRINYIDVQNGIVSKVKYVMEESVVALLLVGGIVLIIVILVMLFGIK